VSQHHVGDGCCRLYCDAVVDVVALIIPSQSIVAAFDVMV